MSAPNLLVLDLSHYDLPVDFQKIKAAGIVGAIYKASQGSSDSDSTYDASRKSAMAAGLLWGAYHFGDNSDPLSQAANFINNAQLDASDLFCLDFEDNGENTMGIDQALDFVYAVENSLNRRYEAVLYSGNLIKEQSSLPFYFWRNHRLWLADYGETPTWPSIWPTYWLWQFTDGTNGPTPHTVDGINGTCDCNSYAGTAQRLASEWATGQTGSIAI